MKKSNSVAVAGQCEEAVCRHCLGRHPATGGVLTDAETDLIHEHRKRLAFAPRETICTAARRPPFFIGNLIYGVVKLDFPGVSGAFGGLLFPGDFLGPFGDPKSVSVTASALSDCELCCFEGEGLHRVFARHPRLQENFLQHFAEAVERAREDAAKLRRPQATSRVAALLQLFADRAAAEDDDGTAAPKSGAEVQLHLRRADIALLLGLTTETVSRCLSRMRHASIIRPLSRRCVEITNPVKLRALAEK